MPAKLPSPVILTGRHVRLEPLGHTHVASLFDTVGSDEEVFRWLPFHTPRTIEQMAALVETYLARPATCLPFAVVGQSTSQAVGITSFWDAADDDEWLEIGGTFHARSVWRSAVNTESKLLLLTHAFEDLGMGRVMWKTDHRNERSQNAIRRLGASYEGTFRRHRRRPDGTWRDTVHFSMLRDEWPAAKARLTERLAAGPPTG